MAWEVQSSDQTSTSEEYATLFWQARAMNAWLFARFDAAPSEAVYEALASCDSPSEIVSLIDRA
jgi:hypothetical protein